MWEGCQESTSGAVPANVRSNSRLTSSLVSHFKATLSCLTDSVTACSDQALWAWGYRGAAEMQPRSALRPLTVITTCSLWFRHSSESACYGGGFMPEQTIQKKTCKPFGCHSEVINALLCFSPPSVQGTIGRRSYRIIKMKEISC